MKKSEQMIRLEPKKRVNKEPTIRILFGYHKMLQAKHLFRSLVLRICEDPRRNNKIEKQKETFVRNYDDYDCFNDDISLIADNCWLCESAALKTWSIFHWKKQ